jgi:hypothetical protein
LPAVEISTVAEHMASMSAMKIAQNIRKKYEGRDDLGNLRTVNRMRNLISRLACDSAA